jgi:hypothetical protein
MKPVGGNHADGSLFLSRLEDPLLSGSAAIEALAGNPVIAGCLIAGALIAAWLTCSWWLMQTPSSSANVAPVHAS